MARRDGVAEYERFYALQQRQRVQESITEGSVPTGGTDGQVIGLQNGEPTWVKSKSVVREYFFS